mmetsp:Transcript_166910/g.535800  ORF Transcript_166910/g.535800 Transcript_166910/m.535800 type:complete len:214 (-) Transcript_166910:550-1191(-)
MPASTWRLRSKAPSHAAAQKPSCSSRRRSMEVDSVASHLSQPRSKPSWRSSCCTTKSFILSSCCIANHCPFEHGVEAPDTKWRLVAQCVARARRAPPCRPWQGRPDEAAATATEARAATRRASRSAAERHRRRGRTSPSICSAHSPAAAAAAAATSARDTRGLGGCLRALLWELLLLRRVLQVLLHVLLRGGLPPALLFGLPLPPSVLAPSQH